MKLYLVIIFSLTTFFAFGQDKAPTTEQMAFDEAMDIYYDEEFDSALVLFHNFLDNHPTSKLSPRVKYNIGYILRETARDSESIPIFEELLESNYNEKERFGGLMEQYALFKHRSASHLADIYLNQGNYELAKKYIRLFDKKYKYKHYCGNELKAHEIYTAKQYARLYHGQGKTDKAIKKLLPYLFDNGLADNNAVLELLDNLLSEQYTEDEIKILVNRAKSSLKINAKGDASIKFLNTKIEVYDHQLFSLDNPEFKENIELEEREKWEKAINTNKLFSKYLK